MTVISASYRTDIPAFYGDWFMQRVREGYVRYQNPYGPQVVTVSLQPKDVHAIVFWSKNYGPFLKHLDELDHSDLDFYFHYTITGLPHALEERVPPPSQTIETFHRLARRYSPAHLQWRYDPVVFSPQTDAAWHVRTFRTLAEQLEGLTARCYFSFLDVYSKVERNVRKLPYEAQPFDPSNDDKLELALQLADIAGGHGIAMYTCTEDFAAVGSIQRGACVDKDILDCLYPHKRRSMKLNSNRGKCGCYDSRDIGAYDTCPHGCVYCYAVVNRPLALKRYQEHEIDHDMMVKRDPKQSPDQGNTDIGCQLPLL
ncbi:MAG: DUF1848 domain-containing protein [Chloroflexota bacterium]|nr:DUF1848 domain-containing protein [Chloroflexota bacterium]